MPKRTYPDQAGFCPRGLGDGFANMRQLYTILKVWGVIGKFLFHSSPIVKTLPEYWCIPYLGVGFYRLDNY